jgi:hypothetical protein
MPLKTTLQNRRFEIQFLDYKTTDYNVSQFD